MTLRERKQARARGAIVDAALALFAERGFDQVTVTDIAERAEVGRTTFFRYFGDKQEVLFAGDQNPYADVPTDLPPITGLESALAYVRTMVVAYVRKITADAERYLLHERLVAEHPELRARSLTKQRRHADFLAEAATRAGADEPTARLAAELGLACYYAGHAVAGDEPSALPGAVAEAFDRLGTAEHSDSSS